MPDPSINTAKKSNPGPRPVASQNLQVAEKDAFTQAFSLEPPVSPVSLLLPQEGGSSWQRKGLWLADKWSSLLLWGNGTEWGIFSEPVPTLLGLEGPLGCRSQQLDPRRLEPVTRLGCPLQDSQWSH